MIPSSDDPESAVIPRDSYTLISWLDIGYPRRCINAEQSMIDAQRYAAKRELIDQLISLRDEQDEIEAAQHEGP